MKAAASENLRLYYIDKCNTIYYAHRKIRDDEARNAFFAELEKEDVNGIYMRDIIKEEMTSDDVRLR